MSATSDRRLARSATLSLALFPTVVVVLNLVQRRDYHPTVQAISELALGSGGAAMVVAFLGLGLGVTLIGVVVHRRAPGERAVPALLWLFALLAGPMSGFFHTDRSGTAATWHGRVHDDSGIAAFVLVLVTMWVAWVRFRRRDALRALAAPTLVGALLGTPAFFLVPLLGGHFGLAQRVYVAVFVTWFVVLSIRLAAGAPVQKGERSQPIALRAR